MKTLITVSALFLVSNMAFGETFAYERQLASEDLDPNIPSLSEGITNPMSSQAPVTASLQDVYRGNPDVEVGPAESDSLGMQKHESIYTAYDMLIESNPDLEV
ncbi:hypothetical protein [Thiolapillus brandeum]|uniref:hypothetical protein n=1 Tax=Thiolapillus brandeum TaxID=1076588 RepID=UPI000597055E|nr:hypothetical protein [Thiolapillus brandeum]